MEFESLPRETTKVLVLLQFLNCDKPLFASKSDKN